MQLLNIEFSLNFRYSKSNMATFGSPKTILIVEDELLYLGLVVEHCKRQGFETVSARTVDEALSLLTELKTIDLVPKMVDAVWVDHFLPEKNGNELVAALLKDDQWKTIPFFLVSNAVEAEITNWYVRAGARECFAKMTTPPEKIVANIDLYLQEHAIGVPDTVHRPR